MGYIFFGFLFLLSFLQVIDMLQGAMLYNMKFAKALQVGVRGGDPLARTGTLHTAACGSLLSDSRPAPAPSPTTQRSRLMDSNFLPSYVDRAMERLSRTLQEEIVVKTPPRPKPTKAA